MKKKYPLRRVFQHLLSSRGYSIVEMMIALTVLGLVIGGALIPLQTRLQEEEINKATNYVKNVQEAVRAFALSNRTSELYVEYYDDVTYLLPAGRPYLPCPDIDLDGLEDRFPITKATLAMNEFYSNKEGQCEQPKGLLPWRTLGVAELDPWGNYLTYRVDRKFSNAALGFDEKFTADMFDITDEFDVINGDLFYKRHTHRNDINAVICSDLIHSVGCPNIELTNIEAGVLSTAALTLGARRINAYASIDNILPEGMIDGPIFVIVSHGRDGRGAIGRHQKCRTLPLATNNLGEVVNAYYRSDHPFITSSTMNCAQVATGSFNLFENQFVTMPFSDITNADVDAPDDIVVWTGRHEMNGYLARNGVYPVDKIEFLLE